MRQEKVNEKAALIFSNAATYIRTYGWQKEGMSVHGKPRCSMGALASAYSQKKWDQDLAELMYKALYEELGGNSLTQFNYKFKSGEKVARLYEQVAEKLSQTKALQTSA